MLLDNNMFKNNPPHHKEVQLLSCGTSSMNWQLHFTTTKIKQPNWVLAKYDRRPSCPETYLCGALSAIMSAEMLTLPLVQL